MKLLRNKIFALFLIPIVLLSTTGFRVEQHECQGELFSISYFSDAEHCEMQMLHCEVDNDFCTSDEIAFLADTNNCCTDSEEYISSGPVNLEKNILLNPGNLQFIIAFSFSYLQLNDLIALHNLVFKYYSPPRVVTDIPVLFQVFLI